ncbi:hypothetical protein GS504_15575 [Rhodococcus hoagii]|nr:hypothetical protein [Prescottella equi]NKR94338.1 hypothetical protein [Prescottella equi]NKS56093.1 hypothetical protein [Prescottella equi]NKS58878.1 hypothetical protein [Prescottella equi]NKS69093.1 hypothetical protein [Prescottella equi]
MIEDSLNWGHVVAALGSMLGAGGVIYGKLAERRTAIEESAKHSQQVAVSDEREAHNAADARWQAMLDQQRKDFEALLDPMRQSIADLTGKVAALETALDDKEDSLRAAIEFIRELLAWIRQHSPGLTPPDVPPSLAADVHPRRR